MRPVTRRSVCKGGLGLLVAAAAPWSFAAGKSSAGPRAKLIGALARPEPKVVRRKLIAENSPGHVNSYDPRTRERISIPVDCWGHAFSQSPVNASMVATTAKWASRGAVVDFRKGALVASLEAPAGFRFFGHSAFSPDGTLYASASADDGKGVLFALDPLTGKILSRVASGGAYPHEFFFLDKETAVIANSSAYGHEGCALTWVSIKDKILRTEILPGAVHLSAWRPDAFLVGTRFGVTGGLGLYTFNPASRQILPVRESAGYAPGDFGKGEALSVVALNDDLVAATTSDDESLLLWNDRSKTLKNQKMHVNTRGLAFHDGSLWMTSARGGLNEFKMNLKNLALPTKTDVVADFSNASHLLVASM